MNHEIREPADEDLVQLRDFLTSVPARDHTFLKEDPADPAVVERWLQDQAAIRRVAMDVQGNIVAACALRAGIGRTSHVADLRLVVGIGARGHGLGTALARHMLIEAVRAGFRKVTVDVEASNTDIIEMFQRLGFQPEALLRDQLRDADGSYGDLVVLAHEVDEQWSAMASAGIAEAVQ
jgi:ribosomal protein S18 acetylase RimI-like enzyme